MAFYENDKGITIEIGGCKGERIAWKDITSITDGKHLPTIYSNHIEYEVTNIDELRVSVQNKEELKQFIGGE